MALSQGLDNDGQPGTQNGSDKDGKKDVGIADDSGIEQQSPVFRNQSRTEAQNRNGQKLHQGQTQSLMLRAVLACTDNMQGKHDGADEGQGIPRIEGRIACSGEKIEPRSSNSHAGHRQRAGPIPEKKKSHYGDQHHVQTGDETAVGYGCVEKAEGLEGKPQVEQQPQQTAMPEHASVEPAPPFPTADAERGKQTGNTETHDVEAVRLQYRNGIVNQDEFDTPDKGDKQDPEGGGFGFTHGINPKPTEHPFSESSLTIHAFSASVKGSTHQSHKNKREPPMPSNRRSLSRSEQKQITRQKLLDTTIDIIAEEGLAGVTLGKVAERTGLSRGICNFHFTPKEQLMLEAFSMLYKEHEQVWRRTLSSRDEGPESRLRTLVETLLSPPIAEDKKLAVWMAFWGVAPHRKTYLELCAGIDREYEAEVEGLLRQLSGGEEIVNGMSLQGIAVCLTAMIDGFWVNYLIAPDSLVPSDAIKACLAFLSCFFPTLRSTFRT